MWFHHNAFAQAHVLNAKTPSQIQLSDFKIFPVNHQAI